MIVAVYSFLRNKKINENGMEADAVISRIDTDTQTDEDGYPISFGLDK